jgi:DNA-binding response OmpR family regulator
VRQGSTIEPDELENDEGTVEYSDEDHFGKRKSHILIAEDDEPLGELLASVITLDGHEVTVVPTADEMQRELRDEDGAHEFDVIITDIRMPGSSGLDVVESIRATGCAKPIIVMTAFPDDSVRIRAASLGTMLLAKPFPLDAMCLAINDLLQHLAPHELS